MKKIKRFYKEHRVFTILMAVLLVCIILIATVLIQCFYVGRGSDKYGNRLDKLEEYKVEESRLREFESKLLTEKIVESATIGSTGRIFYIRMTFGENVDLIEAQSVALKSLDNFSEAEKGYYDFHFTLKKEATKTSDGFLISGAKNKNGSGLVWNNNKIPTTETEEE